MKYTEEVLSILVFYLKSFTQYGKSKEIVENICTVSECIRDIELSIREE